MFPIATYTDFTDCFLDVPDAERDQLDGNLGFIGIIKRQMSLRRNFLNPKVTKEYKTNFQIQTNKRQKKAAQKIVTEEGRSLSPITSEEEE